MDRHDIAHYAIAAVLVAGVAAVAIREAHIKPVVITHNEGSTFGFAPVAPSIPPSDTSGVNGGAGCMFNLGDSKKCEQIIAAGKGSGTGTVGGSPDGSIAVYAVKGAWPQLDQAKTIALGDALRQAGTFKATVFCSSDRCKALASDIDDALQIAGWADDFESGAFGDSEDGLLIGPPGVAADAMLNGLVKAVGNAAGIRVVEMKVHGDVGVIIGKRNP
jgi:hypothetical protein